jgi:tripartite-type tricarboxylate transporter receptor subunit TctC
MKTKTIIAIWGLIVFGAATGFANGASEANYPSKDIQFIVPAEAGGGTDGICRKLLGLVEKELGGSFYVVNKPDSAAAVGPNLIMGEQPTGYTIGSVTYDSVIGAVWRQFIPGYGLDRLDLIALATEESDALMVLAESPYQTFNDLIEGARQNPEKIRIAINGIGQRNHLAMLRIEKEFGVKFNMITYHTSAPQREALINKEVDAAITSLADFASILQSGVARGIVELSAVRNKTYPEVPTIKEFGLGDEFLTGSFMAIVGPAGMPAAIIQKLENAFETAITSDEFTNWGTAMGLTPHFLSGEALDAYIKQIQDKDFVSLDELKNQGIL